MNADVKVYEVSLLIALLSLSLALPLCSARSSTALGSTNSVDTTDFPHETDACSSVAALIAEYSSTIGYDTANWYGSQTTASNIYNAAGGYNDPYSISSYIGGHGGWTMAWNWAGWMWYYEQQWGIPDNDGNLVLDSQIFPMGLSYPCNPVKFVFLWSCEQGDTIGGFHWSGTPFGMPNAWLHTTSLNSDGYVSPDSSGVAFLGFNGSAPYLTDKLDNVDNACHAFLDNFYFAALLLGYNNTINDALDYATKATWPLRTDFGQCWLHTGYAYYDNEGNPHPGNMVVYGDGDMHISNYMSPDVAVTNVLPLKTAVGQGYCMNVSVTAANPGGWNETFEVTAYANEIPFQTQSLTLTPGDSANLTFTWNTTSILYPMGN
ncbi:hypothetical protein MUO69_07135, partial [Candidatus Bathyarchaeota archaeon]|nr:hypothetical protein [Candidatus Bathyarchaeota archaeon]